MFEWGLDDLSLLKDTIDSHDALIKFLGMAKLGLEPEEIASEAKLTWGTMDRWGSVPGRLDAASTEELVAYTFRSKPDTSKEEPSRVGEDSAVPPKGTRAVTRWPRAHGCNRPRHKP